MSRFVMLIQVAGGDDRNSLRDLVDERVLPRIAALGGVSQVMASGGASRELTVWIDPDRCAAAGVTTREITEVVTRTVQRLRYLGGVEDEAGRTSLMLDGRPGGLISIGDIRVAANRPVLLRHVAQVEMGTGREDFMFRVNGKPSVGLVVFQEEGANLVSLGRQLRRRLEELRDEFRPYGVDFIVGFDAAETVQEQLDRLKRLALTGFGVALLVLFLFLREIRAVAVVAVAVPVSLLAAVALLFVGGWTLNLITLFGLAVGIGMLVDNSIVVYEAVQRRLERGAGADQAAAAGGIAAGGGGSGAAAGAPVGGARGPRPSRTAVAAPRGVGRPGAARPRSRAFFGGAQGGAAPARRLAGGCDRRGAVHDHRGGAVGVGEYRDPGAARGG
jgi:multidrug efflux pump subunit AcrB